VKPSLQTIDYPGVINSEGFTQEGCRSETLTNNGLIIPGLLIVRASLRRVAKVKPSLKCV